MNQNEIQIQFTRLQSIKNKVKERVALINQYPFLATKENIKSETSIVVKRFIMKLIQ